jgi:hypothetical protein
MLKAENYPKWLTVLKSFRLNGNFKMGTRFDEISFHKGKEKCSKGVIREIVPNKLIKMEIVEVISGPKLLPVRSFEFSKEGRATEVLWTTIVKTKGMMRLFEFALTVRTERAQHRFLQNLKHLLEMT